MRIGQGNAFLNINNYFGWASQVGTQLNGLGGSPRLSALFDRFSCGSMGPAAWAPPQIGYAAMPDFYNSGKLDVDKKAGVVSTPGGYKVSVANGKVRIQSPNGKFTDLKAEPPERLVTRTTTNNETRTQKRVVAQIPRDPVARESDGDVWRYQGTGSFHLPDGTKITIHEAGEGTGLHIDQVDIYNGNKHVGVKSQLTDAKWQTVGSRVLNQQATAWQNTGTTRAREGRNIVDRTTQKRTVTRQIEDRQRVAQTFKTTFSDVQRDGLMHDAFTYDGQKFHIAGDGDDWSVNGREVVSGAGKGKDDRTKAYQLGEYINPSWQGFRPVEVPWRVYATMGVGPAMQPMFSQAMQQSPGHWGAIQDAFGRGQAAPHLGVRTQMPNMGGMSSIYGGPMGAAALRGIPGGAGFDAFGGMLSSVDDLISIYGGLDRQRARFDDAVVENRLDFASRARLRRSLLGV